MRIKFARPENAKGADDWKGGVFLGDYEVSDDFKRLREAIDQATRGPWRTDTIIVETKYGLEIATAHNNENADCIALLGTVAPELMAVVDAAETIRLNGTTDKAYTELVRSMRALKAALREGK